VLSALHSSRREFPAAPIEFSLKRRGGRLLPLIRLVEYPPPGGPGTPRSIYSPRWRERLLTLASSLSPAAAELREWVDALVDAQTPELELSFGVELEAGAVRLQLYAHVEPRDPARLRQALRRSLEWAQVRQIDAPEEWTPTLTLLAASVGSDARRAVKAYFVRPAEPPAELAFAAPATGLTVLEADRAGAHWLKHDFPCAPHFQRAQPVADAFIAPLGAADARRARQLLDGERFAPWLTWLSAREDTRTIYFIPR
jgi:hypothetical protein